MANKKLSLESKQANLDYRYALLVKEFKELLMDLLPEDGSAIEMVYTDDGGNEILEISRTTVYGEHTQYPIEEMSLREMKTVTYTLIDEMP